jgi:predicted nucleic acid-binding protein
MRLTDLLLRLAEADTYHPLWTEEILGEVERNLPRLNVSKEHAAKRVGVMRATFPGAEVAGYESIVNDMTNHPKDRHVLAAAVHARAPVLSTLKDQGLRWT